MTWTDQSSGYTATRFKDIWAFSPDTVMMCGNYGLVITTFDGGENWIADTVALSGDHLFGIYFVGQTGYVCGNSGAIYKTTDMGNTWTQIDPPFLTAIEEIYFLNEDYGFIAGLNFIYYTENGGESWQQPQSFPGASVNWWLREISFATDSVGYVCGDIGQVYKTVDKGKNWVYMPNSPTDESLQAITAIDDKHLYACGYAGTVMYSADGAESWEVMTAGSSQIFNSMDFTPDGTGFLCSWSGEVLRYINPGTAIYEPEETANLVVYPNPVHNQVNVELQPGTNSTLVEIVDMQGNTVKSKTIEPNQNFIEVSDLQAGIYILRIYSGKEWMTKMLVKK